LIKLYRGFNIKPDSGRMKNIWRDSPRHPVESNIDVHHYADEWFRSNFGVAARSTTIICTTTIKQAKVYAAKGCVMQIHPEKPYRLIYSVNVIDFISYATDGVRPVEGEVRDWLSNQDYLMIDEIGSLPRDFRGEVMVDCEYFDATLN
jgi:hypothetical protein